MKKILSALVALAFFAVSAPAFADETINKAAQPGADAPSGQKAMQQSKSSTKKKSTKKKAAPKTDDKAAEAPAK